MSILVTGGAGFIGSCIVRSLNKRGCKDIIIVDDISISDKWKNIENKMFITYIHKNDLFEVIEMYTDITAIIHMGAQSSTTEKDFDYLWNNNFLYTKRLWTYAANHQIPFIYASSAATYGNGMNGFDDEMDIDCLHPLNGYGYSKQLFDQWVKHQAKVHPSQYVGLKFFNVYGPNEYFKGTMASMVYHGFKQIMESGTIKLFKSCNDKYLDGKQLRDFIYVKDVCNVILWFLDNPNVSGLFNLGTGKARTFEDLAKATFKALKMEENIKYIELPEHLRNKYQYFTEAKMSKLRNVGCLHSFADIEDGIHDYVTNYLARDYQVY